MKKFDRFTTCVLVLCGALLSATPVFANIPGGGTGTGANITLTDNGSTVTMANGIVSILCTKSGATINDINYTYNNGGGTQTQQLLNNGYDGGMLYWETGGFGSGSFTETGETNTGSYAETTLLSTSASNGVMEVHFSMLRGSPGFYVTAIWSHRSQDNDIPNMGETRDNIYAGATFNWMSVDAQRNRLMEVSGGLSIPVQGAPVECYLWTNGIYAGQYEDKYKYSADFGDQRVWGWSSVGTGGLNVGIWNILGSVEYKQNGPMKRDLMEHIGTTILNMHNSSHYGGGANDCNWSANEVWTKVYGPYFIYCNNVTNTLTGTNPPAQALYSDAQAQALAEQGIDTNGQPTGAVGAWPYYWFTNANYAPPSQRGTVSGQFVIADSGNPNASAANLSVGVMQQPYTTTTLPTYDFQGWMKNYQFWVKTDTNGNFTIPNVIAGTNYTLYAFGPGDAGTFQSQNQTNGNPPNTFNLPASPFSVTVTAGATNNLGLVTWTPTRVGATVFEIGYPSRTGKNKFRHGDDYWISDIGPSAAAPSPVWAKFLQYPFDFPNGVNYVVGQSRWTTDWNYVQPCVVDTTGFYNDSSSTITFNLASAPSGTASFYMALCSDYQGAIEVSVNGNEIAGGSGYNPNYMGSGDECDSTIREGVNAAFSDNRISFAASLLHSGQNTINIYMRQTGKLSNGDGYFADHAMYDYIRLELTGYVPPPPASVVAYAGNNCNLVCWPATPGATSYNVLRSPTSGSGYVSVTNGVIGPVCGSGTNNATWLDTAAVNGTAYYYVVQSANPTGSSVNSPQSPGVTPSASVATTAPAAPTGLTVTSSGHQSITLGWSPSAGANYYSVWRSVLVNTGGGSSNTLNTIFLGNTNTATSFTDGSPTDGAIYNYFVTATSSGGTSSNSTTVVAKALPAPPASLPVSLTASFYSTTNVVLNWNAVAGAVGYAIYRATSSGGPYTYLQSVTETVYYDIGLNASTVYYYRVVAVNDAAASANATDSVNSQQTYPASLAATSTNAQVTLTWPAATGATSYTVKRGTSTGNETFNVITGYAGTTYTNTGLINGTTYYYVVTATGTGGTSGNSPEASATPFASSSGIWISPANGSWGAATNWIGGGIATGANSTANFSTLTLPGNLTVTLDTNRTISGLFFGDTSATYNWTLAGTNTLTLGVTPNIDVVNDTATLSTVVAGTTGLSKSGPGTLVLNGPTNAFTGGAVINAGNLTLDYSPANSPPANLVSSANALTLNGGTLQMNGSSNAVSSQTLAATTLNDGASVISAAPASGANYPALALSGITENIGGMVEFAGPATINSAGNVAATATITTTTAGSGSFGAINSISTGNSGSGNYLGDIATVGLYDFATTDTSAGGAGSSPYTILGGSQVAGFYQTAGVTTTSAFYDVNPGGNNSLGNAGGPQGVRFNNASALTITFTVSTAQNIEGFLVTPKCGANNETLAGGAGDGLEFGRYTDVQNDYGVIWQNNTLGYFNINCVLEPGRNSPGENANGLVQAGPGTVAYLQANPYELGTYLNGGCSLVTADSAFGNLADASTVTLNGGTVVGNATFTMDNSGANKRPFVLGVNGGGLAATAGNTMTVDGLISGGAGTGPLVIGLPASSANGNVAGLLPGTGTGTANTTPVYATGTVILNGTGNGFFGGVLITGGATLNINSVWQLGGADYDGGLTFNNGTLQYNATLLNSATDISQNTASPAAPQTVSLPGNATIDLNGNTITFANAIGNGGGGSLTIKSSLAGGSLTLQGADTYLGSTTVTNATLVVSNLAGSATGSGNVLVQNGATLAGNASLAGSVTVATGGTLAPGIPSNALSIGNNLALAAGSKTVLPVQHSPLANGSVNIAGTLTEGGTLIVTNLGGALADGDSFNLLTAANLSGAFSSLVLPPLTGNLIWDTNLFLASGTLTVVTVTTPAIAGIQLAGNSLVLTGSGGVPSWPYVLLATTNLTAPWIPVATNYFDTSGNFDATNIVDPTQPQTFYELQLQ